MRRLSLLAAGLAAAQLIFAQTGVKIEKPMSPPEWALLQRSLLAENSRAVKAFAKQYVDSRGYLLHTPRWGTLDGPDDAIETYYNWTLLHALGGDDDILDIYKLAVEGHLLQYNELRTELTTLAERGAYHKDFITKSDWFHTGEGWRSYFFLPLSDPADPLLIERSKRWAAMYMGEDPDAPNYDPGKKIIKSIWNGSKGPMLRKATTYDWVGDPVPGKYHLLHNPARHTKMLDLMEWYPRMLAHCDEYLDSVGDIHLNLAATILGVQAYALTGEKKYKDWAIEYLDAWKERAAATGGMIPSNIGLDGSLGGEHDGQWWKGTYGWNFTIFDGELQEIAHRNYFTNSSWPGFANGLLLTGDQSYIDVLRRQMDVLYENKKVENGKTLLPTMYGDPRGYKHNGPPEFYRYVEEPFTARLADIYLWSMNRKDLERVPAGRGWIAFLEGNDPDYPVRALKQDLESIRQRMERMRTDPTTPDTRLADWLLRIVPSETDALSELAMGAHFRAGRIWVPHMSRLRYFDPQRSRAGLPPDVGALISKMSADEVEVTLVNLNQTEIRLVDIQGGSYGEHQFTQASWDGGSRNLDSKFVNVRLEPGAGSKLTLKMKRYANQPSFAQPWNLAIGPR